MAFMCFRVDLDALYFNYLLRLNCIQKLCSRESPHLQSVNQLEPVIKKLHVHALRAKKTCVSVSPFHSYCMEALYRLAQSDFESITVVTPSNVTCIVGPINNSLLFNSANVIFVTRRIALGRGTSACYKITTTAFTQRQGIQVNYVNILNRAPYLRLIFCIASKNSHMLYDQCKWISKSKNINT